MLENEERTTPGRTSGVFGAQTLPTPHNPLRQTARPPGRPYPTNFAAHSHTVLSRGGYQALPEGARKVAGGAASLGEREPPDHTPPSPHLKAACRRYARSLQPPSTQHPAPTSSPLKRQPFTHSPFLVGKTNPKLRNHLDTHLPKPTENDRTARMAAAAKKSTSAKPNPPGPSLPPITAKDVRVRVFEGHTDAVYRVAMPEDGSFALTTSDDGTVRRWILNEDVAEGEIVLQGNKFRGLAVTADGSRAAVGDVYGIIRIIDLSTRSVLCKWKGHSDQVGNLVFHAFGHELVSAGEDQYIRRWNAIDGFQLAGCKMPLSNVGGVAATADFTSIVGAEHREGLALWNGLTDSNAVTLAEDVARGSPVSLPADGSFAFTGTSDGKVAKWDLTKGRRVAAFEGHSGEVRAVAVTPDGRFCVSSGRDRTVRLWAAETGECLAVLRGHTSCVDSIAITPDARRISLVGEDKTLRVWGSPNSIQARVATSRKRGYVNAKVVLLGDSGVGKSGLALRLWHDRWEKTESSHGMEIQRLVLPGADTDPDVTREVWLWDLAGQPDYRLTHQLFMEQTALAVLVFDPQKPDLFETVGYWQHALGKVAAKHAVPGILTAARCDRPGLRLTLDEVREWAATRSLHGPILTAAKDGKHLGVAELRALIEKLLPWDHLEFRSTQENFPALKDALLAVREFKGPGGVVVKPSELEARVRQAAPHLTFTPEDLLAVTGLLAGEGVIHALPYGDLVVLNPCWVNSYASTLVKLAGESDNKLGHVPLASIQAGKLPDDGTPRLSHEDEMQLLPALVALFLKRALAWKQETDKGPMLVFPNYVRLPRPTPPPRPGRTVVYRFTGPLEEIYCTLVVRLHYSGLFSGTKLYRQAVDFRTATDKLAALTLRENGERGELDVYFGDNLDADVQAPFQQFVHEHLMTKAKDVERLRNYFCPKPKCGKEALDRIAIDAARTTMKKDAKIFCAYCGAGIPVDDVLEKQFTSKEGGDAADAAGRKAGEKQNTASMEQVMVGEVMALVGAADQIYRIQAEPDEGVDGEIEFRDAKKKKATGITFRVQLKSGDSHLKQRKDGSEVFAMKKHYADYWAGKGKVPVLLIIRSSDGRIRYMNATKAIHAAKKKTPGKPVTQLIFTGKDFTPEAVQRLRDELLP
jgi:WD40 repeat protein